MNPKKFCVIGLGHFGLHLAINLSDAGAEVLAIDNNEDRINMISDRVTYAVKMDATNKKALSTFGLEDMDAVIIAIGEGFEDSIMTTAIVQELGVKKIYNRIISPVHERLINLMNVENHLVPEAEAAKQLADRLLMPGLIESFKISKNYGIFEINVPTDFIGKTLIEVNLRENYKLNLVTVKREEVKKRMLTLGETAVTKVIGVPSPDYIFLIGDVLVLFGEEKHIRDILENETNQ